jgi:hypothetical protein
MRIEEVKACTGEQIPKAEKGVGKVQSERGKRYRICLCSLASIITGTDGKFKAALEERTYACRPELLTRPLRSGYILRADTSRKDTADA